MKNSFVGSRVLVTGGRSGFLGTNFVNALAHKGANVVAQGLGVNHTSYIGPDIIRYTEDLTKATTIFENHEFDYVFHCAAFTGGATVIKDNPGALTTINTFMNTNVLDAAARKGVKKFVYISSTAIYPESDLPLSEEMGFQGDPEKNFFSIGWMKRYGEKLAEYYSKHGMKVVIIRPSNVYGPYSSFDPSHSHVIPALIRRFVANENPLVVWGRPDIIRDFIYVDDFVRGTLMAFEKEGDFNIYNIATGIKTTIYETSECIKSITGYNGEVVFDSTKPITKMKQIVNVTKAKTELGFECEYPIYDGLERTINWYKESYL